MVLVPRHFHSAAGRDDSRTAKQSPLTIRTEGHEPGLENYDIRTDKSDAAVRHLLAFRQENGKTAVESADTRENFVRGEIQLRRRVPTLKIEYNRDIRIPEVIAPDVKRGKAFLTESSAEKRVDILRRFISRNNSLVGLETEQIDRLETAADYTNPAGNMSFVHLRQTIDGIPVFRGEVKAGFTKSGEIIRVINNLAPELNYASLSSDFGDPAAALRAAAKHSGYELKQKDLVRNEAVSDDRKTVFGTGERAPQAEKIYFPTEPGTARPAWRVLIWKPVNAYLTVIDAATGTLLWRKNLTEDQTQSATYEVYRNANAYMDVAESPAPLTPGPFNTSGTQGALLTRENVTLIGNEGNLSFNNRGWIDDGGDTTFGNNTIAGLDRSQPDGVDIPVRGANRFFNSSWNPPPGNPAPGDFPTTNASQTGAVIQMFYVVNRFHDSMYQVGFTEPALNFQNDNFGRGGAGGDRISAEGQDSSGTNNANFTAPPDGIPGRMQMYIFTGPSPDRDGTADADVIIHELTHGTSNRLHGNSTGLSSRMARGMGEGWSDWYAHVLTSEPNDPADGIYTIGGYLTITTTSADNFYYGIRRFPKAIMSSTGGTNNRPHNPLTFADLNTGCNILDGAFPPAFGGSCDQVHNAGEIWSSALWELRTLLVQRLGFQTGTRRALQIVTDAMKISPLDPTFLQSRDAIIAAARANGNSADPAADVRDVWEAFRIRGMGFSASIERVVPALVTEAFDQPNVEIQDPGFAASDAPGDGDGFYEPGETLALTVPVLNNTGNPVSDVTVNIGGGTNTSYGTIADGATVTRQIVYTVPANAGCGSLLKLDLNIAGSAGARTENRNLVIGQPDVPISEVFDSVSAPALPAGWSSAQTGPGLAFVTQTGNADSAPNSMFTPNRGLGGGNSGATLDSPVYTINTAAGLISFRNKYDTESGWDGGVLEISVNNGSFRDILEAGGTFIEGGYNGAVGVNQNPLDGRPAWTGNSGGYITSTAVLPPGANGQPVRFRWRFGEDTNTSSVGWNIDGVEVTTSYSCQLTATGRARFDYDGDRRTDVSIFRSASGEWWYRRSSDNAVFAAQFGTANDRLTPADFTGDGRTDLAFWREATGEWFVLRSEDNSFYSFPFGIQGDIPAPGDFDGDGRADPAVFRPSSGTWFILRSSDEQTQSLAFGIAGDKPIVGDYDGDSFADIAVFRPSTHEWWILRSTAGLVAYQFGTAGDRAVPADYTGDRKTDVAFWRESTGEWFVLRSEDNSFFAFPFGQTGDIPVPGDYDGDGRSDAALFRPAANVWYLQQTSDGFAAVGFGSAGDTPTPSVYNP